MEKKSCFWKISISQFKLTNYASQTKNIFSQVLSWYYRRQQTFHIHFWSLRTLAASDRKRNFSLQIMSLAKLAHHGNLTQLWRLKHWIMCSRATELAKRAMCKIRYLELIMSIVVWYIMHRSIQSLSSIPSPPLSPTGQPMGIWLSCPGRRKYDNGLWTFSG